jgi:hypothetical protein
MTATVMHGVPVFVVPDDGAPLTREQDAVDLIANVWEHGSRMFVIPVRRLPAEFFDLSTGLAGALLQKFVGYRSRVVILGDISAYTQRSSALASLVYESNRGRDVWFLQDLAELDERLRGGGGPPSGGR